MLKSHSGRDLGMRMILLGAAAWAVLICAAGPASGQTQLTTEPGEATVQSGGSATIDWTMPVGAAPDLKVTVFYGPQDGGTDAERWADHAELQRRTDARAKYRVVLKDLKPETAYVFRIRAADAAGAAWSATANFKTQAWSMPWYLKLLIVVVLVAIPFYSGGFLAKRVRMPDHGWKIGLILGSLLWGLAIIGFGWPPKLGVDLSGGTILVYEVDQAKKDPNKPVDMDKLIDAVSERVNPGGQKEMTIRPYGSEQIEIIIPRIDPEEAKRIEKIVSQAGTLEFRILANRKDHADLLKRARSDPSNVLKDALGNIEAWWVPVQVGQEENFESYLYRFDAEGRRIRIPESQQEVGIRETVRRGETTLELLVVKDVFDVTGAYLADASRGYDSTGNPCVEFQFDHTGARLFQGLTSSNLPTEDVEEFYRKLGIILDGRLYSAPRIKSTISDRGVIEGSFTAEEVDDLVRVLNAGSLPTALNAEPISRLTTGPTLGHDTIVKGCWAIGASAVLVLLFMMVYYRFAGITACAALLTNLVLILAIMMLVKAAFTLPGLAGLVLTVGMAVDANVLIFERIREELARGAALRMAIRNGFDRATTTIVDANVTTLITGVILFWIGTDQVKGFAITLILGVLMSMYTAIFCSRVVFDIGERRRWITKLTMMRLLGATQFDFLGKRRLAAAFSLTLIVAGLAGVVYRSGGWGVGLFDIDFTGGVSVVAVYNQQQNIAKLRDDFGEDLPDLAVSDIQLEEEPRWTWFQINTSQREVNSQNLADWAVRSLKRQLEKIPGAGGDAQQQAAAIRGPVLDALGQKPNSDARRSAVEAIQRRVADLFATAPQGPDTAAALGAVQRDIGRILRVTTPIDYVEEFLHQRFPGQLASNTLAYGEPTAVTPAKAEAAQASPKPPAEPSETDQTRDDLPDDTALAMAGAGPLWLAQTPAGGEESPPSGPAEKPTPAAAGGQKPEAAKETPEKKAEEPTGKPAAPDDGPEKGAAEPESPGATPGQPSEKLPEAEEPPPEPAAGAPLAQTQARLTFARKVSYDTVYAFFVGEFGSEKELPWLELTPLVETSEPGQPLRPDAAFMVGDATPYKDWDVKIDLPPKQTRARLDSIRAAVADTPFFPSSNTIGSRVAGSTRMQAIYALAASLLFIVAYIWIRFQRVIFGLAAVIALVHDVLVTLGVIALSAFLAPYLGILLIDPFKIGLTVLSAFLTIIGYSLNDTIVVFDRIREVRGKAPQLTEEMVNTSINQTLSRTLLTSLTTLLVVVILYMFGGEVIHAFAFALVVGVVIGTYSSVFVASPVLLWMTRPPKGKK